jgi:hypothetical protein
MSRMGAYQRDDASQECSMIMPRGQLLL